MTEIFQLIVENAPNMVGLIVAVYVLYRLLARYQDDISKRIDKLDDRLTKIEAQTRQ